LSSIITTFDLFGGWCLIFWLFFQHFEKCIIIHFPYVTNTLPRGGLHSLQPRLDSLFKPCGVVCLCPVVEFLGSEQRQLLINELWNVLIFAIIRASKTKDGVEDVGQLCGDLALRQQVRLPSEESEELLAILGHVAIAC